MKVPYSEKNTDHLPIPSIIFLTLGPAPLPVVINCISQTEEQGWVTRFVIFAGMEAPSPIATKGMKMAPLYQAVICKVYNEGDEIVEPVIRQAGPYNGKVF